VIGWKGNSLFYVISRSKAEIRVCGSLYSLPEAPKRLELHRNMSIYFEVDLTLRTIGKMVCGVDLQIVFRFLELFVLLTLLFCGTSILFGQLYYNEILVILESCK